MDGLCQQRYKRHVQSLGLGELLKHKEITGKIIYPSYQFQKYTTLHCFVLAFREIYSQNNFEIFM